MFIVTDLASLREVPVSKRDVIVENHCLIQESPFDVRFFFSDLATTLFKR